MKVYFACSITGGRQDEAAYQQLVGFLLAEGHDVPTAHLSSSSAPAVESEIAPREVYDRDLGWITDCDALVAEVSTPSHGVGYEIALALGLGKPVVCCYQADRRVSKMITGNHHPGLRLLPYRTPDELVAGVRSCLAEIQVG